MQHEIIFLDNSVSSDSLRKLHNEIKFKPDLIVTLSGNTKYLKRAKNIYSLVDFPTGTNSTVVRICEIEDAVKNGAMGIDIVVNPTLLTDKNSEAIYDDFVECFGVCNKHEVPIRPIIEYRFSDYNYVVDICKILSNAGCTKVILGTGTVLDNQRDIFGLSMDITEVSNLAVSCCISKMDKPFIQKAKEYNISSLRQYYNKEFNSFKRKIK